MLEFFSLLVLISSNFTEDEDASLPPSRSSSIRSGTYTSDTGNSFAEERESDGMYFHIVEE